MKLNEYSRSALWALAISLPISLWGYAASLGLAHASGFLSVIVRILFAPFFAFDSLDAVGTLGETAYLVGALLSQLIGYFAVVFAIRSLLRRFPNHHDTPSDS